MKIRTLGYVALSSLIMSVATAQTMTGPGVTDDPPTAAMEKQNDKVKPGTSLSKAPTVQSQPKPIDDPQEKSKMTAPRGAEAKEAVKNDSMDLSKKEIQKKQKGH